MLNTPSVMSSLRCDAGRSRRIPRAASTSLCGNTLIAARLSRQPSMMLAWFSSSRDDDVLFREHRRHGAGVGGEAALEDDHCLGVLELGEPALQFHVHRHRAGDRPHRAGPDAVALDGLDRPRAKTRMRGQPEVVVRREVHDRAAVERRVRALLVLEHPEVPVEALRLERLQFRRQVTEWVDSRRGHVCTLYQGGTGGAGDRRKTHGAWRRDDGNAGTIARLGPEELAREVGDGPVDGAKLSG